MGKDFRSWLFCIGMPLELLYLFLVALAPLPQLHLHPTPLITGWPWTLALSHLLFSRALVSASRPASGDWPYILLLAIIFLALAALHLFAVGKINKRDLTGENSFGSARWLLLLLIGAALFGITLLLQPALFSDDVFRYIFSGRILTVYHADPMTTAPAQFPLDPYLSWITQPGTPNVYGPLWLAFSSLLVRIGASPLTTLLLFKASALVFHLLNCVLVWAILGKIAPARRFLGTLLYAWNPLGLIEIAGNGHNEAALIFLFLLAVWLRVQGEPNQGPDRPLFLTLFATSERSGPSKARTWGVGARFIAPPGGANVPGDQPIRGRDKSGPYIPPERRWSRYEVGALALLGIAAAINFIALLVAVMYIWFAVHPYRGIAEVSRNAGWRVLVVLIPIMLLYIPFWHGGSTYLAITSSMNIEPMGISLVNMLATPLREFFNFLALASNLHSPDVDPIPAANAAVLGTTIFIYALIYLYLLGKLRKGSQESKQGRPQGSPIPYTSGILDTEVKSPGFDILLRSWSIALVGYVILVLGAFWPSFVLSALWVTALRRFDALNVSVLLLSYTALFIYALLYFENVPVAVYAPILIFGIPLIYLLPRRKRRAERNRLFYGG